MKSFLAGALVATIVSAGVTYAVASGSTDTVTACADKKTGVLRLSGRKACKKTETKVSWPTSVAQGTQGATGPKGDTGPSGTNGLSATYGLGFNGFIPELSSTPLLMGSINLPAGSYIVTATLIIFPTGSGTSVSAKCNFDGGGWRPQHRIAAGANGGTISMQTDITFAGNGGTLGVECTNSASNDHLEIVGYLYATAIDSITMNLPT